MAEVVVNLQSENQDIKRLAKYECSKMNLSQELTIEQVESEIKWLQNQLDNKIEEYENAVRELEELVKILNKRYLSKTKKYQMSFDITKLLLFVPREQKRNCHPLIQTISKRFCVIIKLYRILSFLKNFL